MGCKEGIGKFLVWIFTAFFAAGVIASCCAPQWIGLSSTPDSSSPLETINVQYGPFYSQVQACSDGVCQGWDKQTISLTDCETISDGSKNTLCTHLNTWRTMASICLALVVVGGCLVLAACCCQAFTCGCCGGSLDCIANVLFWIEVILSIVGWSFTIASVQVIKDAPNVNSVGYLWGFWVFIFAGTVGGALAAVTADWAAEDSVMRTIFRCLTCRCRKD